MRYYVVADIHGFFDEFRAALDETGFFADSEPHKLIICGDLFDRGQQALTLQNFIIDLLDKEAVILIRGNHEDLAIDLLNRWNQNSYLMRHHLSNGTVDTALQLTGAALGDLAFDPECIGNRFRETPYIKQIIPAMCNFYETPHFIFTHGWIPCTTIKLAPHSTEYVSSTVGVMQMKKHGMGQDG